MLIQLSSCSNYPLRQSHRHIYQAQLPPLNTLMFPQHLVSSPVPQLRKTLLLPSRPGVTLSPSRHSCMGLCIFHELHVACFMPPVCDSNVWPLTSHHPITPTHRCALDFTFPQCVERHFTVLRALSETPEAKEHVLELVVNFWNRSHSTQVLKAYPTL